MRIVVCHSPYLSGASSGENRVVADEVRLLREAGHDVALWQPRRTMPGAVGQMRAGTQAVWSRRASRKVERVVRRSQAEIVHCHNLFPALSPAVIRAAAGRGATVVMSLHNYRLLCLPATFLRDGRTCELCLGRTAWRGVVHGCYRQSRGASAVLAASLGVHRALRTFDRVSLFLASSAFMEHKHAEAGFDRARMMVKPNFAWAGRRREGPGDAFLYLGRLWPEKGVAQLLREWPSGARLVVVGAGPELDELRKTAPPEVEFRPPVGPDEVPTLLRGARALVVPSLSYEGSPRAVLEALAAGVAVLAPAFGSLPEFVDDGESGVLVRRGPGGWAAAVRRLQDDAESERLGDGAWRAWSERFSPRCGLEALERAYGRAQEARACAGS